MPRDPRYDVLFEPVKIGPVTAKNRFYQVPHCNGMGYVRPNTLAGMRGMKAEGGWAVVATEEVDIHHSSEVSPFCEGRLWDERDIPYHAKVVDKIHAHGGLAAIEFVHQGHHISNRMSRTPPMSAHSIPVAGYDPLQSRAMDKADFLALRRWHRAAVKNAMQAGYDIVYVYAGHDLCLTQHLLAKRYNQRTDEYGGSLENRVRLFRELIEDTKEAVGHKCGVAVRFAVDELLGPKGITSEAEGREVVEMLAELPDIWDVNVSDWPNDSVTARFGEEGGQEKYIAFVKQVTTKPVVGVGRVTSPDAMVSQIRRGILDMIGAARPSIADPFLPRKIEEGRLEDIRECIGCNVCVTGDYSQTPIRCTQNPTMGEEWRKGWHPEQLPARRNDASVLVVGAGPAGLEAARALGQRGYRVTLAEAADELGGRVTKESRLPGLATWARVRDWRLGQLDKLTNVEIFRGGAMTAADVLGFGAAHVALATGATWRRDGVARWNLLPIPVAGDLPLLTPDDVMAGAALPRHLLIYDDDHYYMANVLAELALARGSKVTFVTPAAQVAPWTLYTMEQHRIQARLLESGAEIITKQAVTAIGPDGVTLTCDYTGRTRELACDGVLLVTARHPKDALCRELQADAAALRRAGILGVTALGDAVAPSTIAAAVYDGHRYAREIEDPVDPDRAPFRREFAVVTAD